MKDRLEEIAYTRLELQYMNQTRQKVYIACETLDFIWDEKDIKQIDQLWRDGYSIWDIAEQFDRDPDELLILLIDRAKRGRIKPRKGGVLGWMQSPTT